MLQILGKLLLFILLQTHCDSQICTLSLSAASGNYTHSVDGYCFRVDQETFISPQISSNELEDLFRDTVEAEVNFHVVDEENLEVFATHRYTQVYDEGGNFIGEHEGIFIVCVEKIIVPNGLSLIQLSSFDSLGRSHDFAWIILKSA